MPPSLLLFSLGALPMSVWRDGNIGAVFSVAVKILKPVRAFIFLSPHHLIPFTIKLKANLPKFYLVFLAQAPFLSSGCSADYVRRSDTRLFLVMESWQIKLGTQ